MASHRKLLHFTLGPVQGFIADARRTRDLWAGSFLLSWLSGQAMAALARAHGRIIFPKVDEDDLFKAIMATRDGEEILAAPFIGSLPNRFKAEVTEAGDLPGETCRAAIAEAWKGLTDAVYAQFIEGEIESLGKDTKVIWDRQVVGFWDMNWVAGEELGDGSDGRWLDRRKNWRTHYGGKAGTEGGDHCRLMGRYQEISGYHRIGSRREQQAFWEALSEVGGIGALDLKADERLCAIALTKRLFPRLDCLKQIIGWTPGEGQVDVLHWPSVSYIAAVPWLKAADNSLGNSEQSAYWRDAHKNLSSDFMGESATKWFGFPGNGLFKLDGHLLHRDGVAAWPGEDLEGKDDAEKAEARGRLLQGLTAIEKKLGARASEFYAVLLMDGDSIGKRLGINPCVVRDGLASFTARVKKYFAPPNDSNGVLIYAGGDDVLALMPVDTAIHAARMLRKQYDLAFEDAKRGSASLGKRADHYTMSAAIVFAQYKIPLRRVLSQAHHFLDDIAKARNGRDSVAIAVVKPGGLAFSWVSAWGEDETGPLGTLIDLSRSLNADRQISSSLFYNLKNRYGPLFDRNDTDRADGGQSGASELFGENGVIRSLIQAELRSSGKKIPEADQIADRLLTIGKPLVRDTGETKPIDGYDFDSGLIARFLSQEGRWRLRGS